MVQKYHRSPNLSKECAVRMIVRRKPDWWIQDSGAFAYRADSKNRARFSVNMFPICRVRGPGMPVPMTVASIVETGMTSMLVLVRKHSSASYNSDNL